VEKLVSKDVKLRTFIASDADRDSMVASVYDTTYEVIRPGVDTLVVIDDSIVRGTTLEKSILTTLGSLECQANCDCILCTSDSLSRLLWYRYVKDERVCGFSSGDRAAQGPRNGK